MISFPSLPNLLGPLHKMWEALLDVCVTYLLSLISINFWLKQLEIFHATTWFFKIYPWKFRKVPPNPFWSSEIPQKFFLWGTILSPSREKFLVLPIFLSVIKILMGMRDASALKHWCPCSPKYLPSMIASDSFIVEFGCVFYSEKSKEINTSMSLIFL